MNKTYLFVVMASLLVFSTATFVYAHNIGSGAVINDNYYSEDEMNEMHNEMMQNINDPELVSEMNEMYENCIQSVRGNEYTAVRGNMMGAYGMMGGGMM